MNLGGDDFPRTHTLIQKHDAMNELEMLIQVIFAIESFLFKGSPFANRVVVGCDMVFVRVDLATKGTTDLACVWVDDPGPVRFANPFFEG